MHPLTAVSLAEERICGRIRRSDERRMVEAARTAREMLQPKNRWFRRLGALFGRHRARDEMVAARAYLCGPLSFTR